MGLLDFLGFGKKTKPAPASSPMSEEADFQARRKHRMAVARERAAKLPASLDSPFFHDLAKRWTTEPTLAAPIGQLCTATQFEEPDYKRICALFQVEPRMRRKQWEFVYIYRAIEAAGVNVKGSRGLGFGVGKEKLPSLLAADGCAITATDLPADHENTDWVGGPQHAQTVEALRWPDLVETETFDKLVSFRPVNMKDIPSDLDGYDFCWSACALEHLGGLDEGFDFIRASLDTLRPGGLAVHTTEFNLGSDEKTLATGGTVVYREKDILTFADEMAAAGHQIEINLAPGATPTDRMIDRFRDDDVHIRLYVMHQIPATSIGLTVRKKG